MPPFSPPLHHSGLTRNRSVTSSYRSRVGPLGRRPQRSGSPVIARLTNSQIARVLGISERTVQAHVSRILRALGLPSRAGVGPALGSVAVAVAVDVSDADGAVARTLLTPRQQQVADLVVRGYTNDGVARVLQGVGQDRREARRRHLPAALGRLADRVGRALAGKLTQSEQYDGYDTQPDGEVSSPRPWRDVRRSPPSSRAAARRE
jgi:DNA-binding CsgD family transcriptional regulator